MDIYKRKREEFGCNYPVEHPPYCNCENCKKYNQWLKLVGKEQKELTNLTYQFAQEMLNKIIVKMEQWGYVGWDNSLNKSEMMDKLAWNVREKDWIDIATFAMFLWNLEQEQIKIPKGGE